MKKTLLVVGISIMIGVIAVSSTQVAASARNIPETARKKTKQTLENVHMGVNDYFEEYWPTTHNWYNWWAGD